MGRGAGALAASPPRNAGFSHIENANSLFQPGLPEARRRPAGLSQLHLHVSGPWSPSPPPPPPHPRMAGRGLLGLRKGRLQTSSAITESPGKPQVATLELSERISFPFVPLGRFFSAPRLQLPLYLAPSIILYKTTRSIEEEEEEGIG